MRITKKILTGMLILVLILMSGAHVLADENQDFQLPNNEEYQEPDEVLDNLGEELDVSEESFGDTDGSYCVFGDVLGCCDDQKDELELEDVDVNEINVEELGLEDYERMDLLFIASPILHTPDEQLIAVFFEEEMLLTGATLHTRSLVTGEEFVHPYYMIIENTVSFVINHPEGSGEDEILLVSIEYNFEEHEEPVVLEFSDHGIETSYTVTNEPMPGSEESGIVIYGIAEDGEVVSETTDIENLSETIEEIIYAIDEGVVEHLETPTEVAPTSAVVTGIAPTSTTVTGIAPTSAAMAGIAPTSEVTRNSANHIIVVSAGHCSTHAGAVANGLIEHELNWHVAGVVVNELNAFPGITAIRDRPTIDCRWPGGGWQRCVTERVRQAGRDGASVFVDIHFNAAENPAANGAEIWIPNTSVNDGMHQAGRQLSDEILRRLKALGMNSRGHRTVPNGQLELATNRIARELGMIGILVEGGFLTNTGDANRLRDPNFRHQLGVQVARGIATVVGVPPSADGIPLWRMFHPGMNQHLWTTSAYEYRVLSTRGWNQEGIAWLTPRTGRPVHRLFHEGIRRHHYTADQHEIRVLRGRGWNDEGPLFYCASPNVGSNEGIRMTRLFNERASKHLHTADPNEVRILTQQGWRNEGISFVGFPAPRIPEPPGPGLTPIMGATQTNVAQMVRHYNNTSHTFPSGALGMSLEAFAQLVLDEANREGVRAEVLWAQVMRETGWLQFGGCVRIEQFNFGGLGATGGGNPGHSFPSVQIGLRAQVHHLVAYATTTPVRNPSNREHPVMRTSPPWGPTGQTVVNGTESPRFHFVPRGISPYVNWLGQGENPNHPGFWAADRNYGAALAAAIAVLLNS